MKSFLDLAINRYSVRSYSDKQIEKEKLERILRAGQVAPTAANRQPQKILVFQSPEAIETVRSVTRYAFNAPTVLLICADKDLEWTGADGHKGGMVDAAIVTASMMFEAWDEGIGSCWVRGFDANVMHAAFHLPNNLEIVAMLPLGYPSETAKPAKGWHDRRKPLEETVEYL